MAVKVLSIELESMRGEREFLSELASLSLYRHENLVKLLGCCVEGASRYLVYDYMENNSLTQILLGNPISLCCSIFLFFFRQLAGMERKLENPQCTWTKPSRL